MHCCKCTFNNNMVRNKIYQTVYWNPSPSPSYILHAKRKRAGYSQRFAWCRITPYVGPTVVEMDFEGRFCYKWCFGYPANIEDFAARFSLKIFTSLRQDCLWTPDHIKWRWTWTFQFQYMPLPQTQLIGALNGSDESQQDFNHVYAPVNNQLCVLTSDNVMSGFTYHPISTPSL